MSLKAQDVYAILNGKIEEGSSSTPTDINYNDLQNQPVYNVTVENGKFNLCNVTESGLYRLYNPNGILIMLNGLEGSNGDFTEKNMAAFSYNVIYVFINIRISTNNNKYITAKSMYGEEKRYNYISCIYTYETNTWKSEKINTVLNLDNFSEYTPKADYNPATKKYVDDSVNNIGTTKVNTSQGIENAGKVLGINEEGNVVPVDASSGSGSGSIFNESIVVNEDGEIEVITTIPTIYVNMETANLETDSNVFSVDKNGYLISSK